MLLPLFLLISVAITWFKESYDFVDKLKRVFVSTLLVISFPEITDAILAVTSGLADKIGDMNNLENIMSMASEKMKDYSKPSVKSLLAFPNFLLATFCYLSYLLSTVQSLSC